jgi:REP-associated tyrosine transposase
LEGILKNYNPDKHHRKSIRLKEYDYSNPNWYYVTICTKDFKHWFGKVSGSEVRHNDLGKIAIKYFREIPIHFENIEIDYFIVMPNHVHGIVIINNFVGTRDRVSLQQQFGKQLKNSLSLIINQYKGSVTRYARKNGCEKFAWQSRFYDHIIRNEQDLHRIRKYIQNNPLKWEVDEYYT